MKYNGFEKDYTVPGDIMREGFDAYQKKFIYPKSYAFMAVFIVLALNFIYGAVKAPDNYFAYMMIVVCIALAVREWYNPRKLRRNVIEAMQDIEGTEYRIRVGEDYAEFSTIEQGNVENNPLPPTRISAETLKILEYDGFFLFLDGRAMFFIVPKNVFSESETEIIRNLDKN
ncbi:MAG: hypothetical protein NC340_00670 [Ruminococcus flavefaciens]|nr:hypothetical protein [Ruminococcus flavefaciens]